MLLHEVTFRPRELTDDGYAELTAQVAPSVAELPGLILKIWTGSDAEGRFGGVYLWRDREAMVGYVTSELFQTVAAFPHFADIATRDFAVHEDLTRVTQPGLPVLAVA